MPEIRERDPNDFIKSKGNGKHRGKKGNIAPRIDNAVRGKVREHRGKKEESNEYAVGVTEEAAAEVAIEAKHIPGNIKRTVQHLQPKTKERVLNDPEQGADGPEAIEPEEPGHAPDPIEQQQRELAAKKGPGQSRHAPTERSTISRWQLPSRSPGAALCGNAPIHPAPRSCAPCGNSQGGQRSQAG